MHISNVNRRRTNISKCCDFFILNSLSREYGNYSDDWLLHENKIRCTLCNGTGHTSSYFTSASHMQSLQGVSSNDSENGNREERVKKTHIVHLLIENGFAAFESIPTWTFKSNWSLSKEKCWCIPVRKRVLLLMLIWICRW